MLESTDMMKLSKEFASMKSVDSIAKKRSSQIIQTAACQNYYLGIMEVTLQCVPSSDRKSQHSSLPKKIKIRTCKLPKDFFQPNIHHILKVKSGCESRGSTCDEEDQHPRTPFFKDHRQTSQTLYLYRKAETARLISAEISSQTTPARERRQSIRRKLSEEVSQRFPILLLPPIITQSRIFKGL